MAGMNARSKLFYCKLDDGKIRLVSNQLSVIEKITPQLIKNYGFAVHSESKDGREISKWTDQKSGKKYYGVALAQEKAICEKLMRYLDGKGHIGNTQLEKLNPHYTTFKQFFGMADTQTEEDALFESIIPSPEKGKMPAKKKPEKALQVKAEKKQANWLSHVAAYTLGALSALGFVRGCAESGKAIANPTPIVASEEIESKAWRIYVQNMREKGIDVEAVLSEDAAKKKRAKAIVEKMADEISTISKKEIRPKIRKLKEQEISQKYQQELDGIDLRLCTHEGHKNTDAFGHALIHAFEELAKEAQKNR